MSSTQQQQQQRWKLTPKRKTTTSATTASTSVMTSLPYKPTLLEVKPMRFVIMDAPRPNNVHLYVKELSANRVKDLVRVCEATYHAEEFETAGITCHDLEYPDGHSPPPDILERWLELVESTFYHRKKKEPRQQQPPPDQIGKRDGLEHDNNNDEEHVFLAVHCVAGLGRAPVLVAIALIEFARMDVVEAVALIRRHRKGSINEKQLLYLEEYKRRSKRKGRDGNSSPSCIIS